MRIGIAVLVFGVGGGCKTHDMLPIVGGGDDTIGSGSHVDAAGSGTDAPDGQLTIHGQACRTTDLRDLRPCASTGANGLTVHLGAQMTTTMTDSGTFAIVAPSASNVEWQVSGGTIRTSLTSYSAVAVVPVIDSTTFNDLEISNGILEVTGQGAIVAHVVHNNAPVAGATATTSPSAVYAPYYDSASVTNWNQNMTGTHGAIWVPGLPTGTATLTVTPTGGTAQLITGIPIGDKTITFVTVEI